MNMSNTATEEKGLVATATQNVASKAGENIGNRAVNWVINKLNEQYGKTLVLTGSIYERYLDNAYQRYNQVKTLVTGIAPRPIIGSNSIYISVGVEYKAKEFSTDTVEKLLSISRNLLICGTGGAGKSMLMRYLFLNTVNRGEHIPVFLELRRINEKLTTENAFMDLIYKCMQDFDTELPHEQFEYSLRLGKYIFFLDGFDEIKSVFAENAAEAIQKFAAKYPENAYIMTSRPDRNFSSLETFTQLKTKGLTKIQAVIMSGKFWEKDEKTIDFCRQLELSLYDQHKDFAQNPLLLSMMFLTFMHNGNIPDHRVDFYEKCYNALYNMHDNRNKGTYKREFECANINEHEFKLLFARFCYRTYIENDYEFSEKEIIRIIDLCIQKLKIAGITAQSYLNDLCKVVCLIVREGDTYYFSHRSLQAYFAAVYVTGLPDDHQEIFYTKIFAKSPWELQYDAFIMAYQLSSERFIHNALEKPLRELVYELKNAGDAELYALRKLYTERFSFHLANDSKYFSVGFSHATTSQDCIAQNVIKLVRALRVNSDWIENSAYQMFAVGNTITKYIDKEAFPRNSKVLVSIEQLDSLDWFSKNSYKKVIEYLLSHDEVKKTISAIYEIIENLDKTVAILSDSENIFDDL